MDCCPLPRPAGERSARLATVRRATLGCGCGCWWRQRLCAHAVDHADSRLHGNLRRVARAGSAPSNAVVAMGRLVASCFPDQCCCYAALTTYSQMAGHASDVGCACDEGAGGALSYISARDVGAEAANRAAHRLLTVSGAPPRGWPSPDKPFPHPQLTGPARPCRWCCRWSRTPRWAPWGA